MRKNNMWNRLFHKEEIKANIDTVNIICARLNLESQVKGMIERASTLAELLEVHKKAWAMGYQNQNIGPCEWGMFRCKTIEAMQPKDVFLGDIYGLWTNNIPFWETHKDANMAGNGWGIPDDTKIYDLIFRQYKGHLLSNIRMLVEQARLSLPEFQKLGYQTLMQHGKAA